MAIIQQQIEHKLQQAFADGDIQVLNESYMHNVAPGSESHFKVRVVSEQFNGMRLIQRHRTINALLADELATSVHALAIHTYTPQEWLQQQQQLPASPNCLGGNKL